MIALVRPDGSHNRELAIQAEYQAVLSAPDLYERKAHLDRLMELMGQRNEK